MSNHDRISSIILAHWQNYHPTMVAQFRQENRLEAELEKTAQQFSNLMYELVAVKKLDYSKAWEVAIRVPAPGRGLHLESIAGAEREIQ